MIEYVAGLYFSRDLTHVAIVEKQTPLWQKGKYNAIGGKIEEGESAQEAMIREFQEETGVLVTDWEATVELEGEGWIVYFFHAFGDPFQCKTVEEEVIFSANITELLESHKLIANLRVIIPIALDNTGIVKPVFLLDRL